MSFFSWNLHNITVKLQKKKKKTLKKKKKKQRPPSVRRKSPTSRLPMAPIRFLTGDTAGNRTRDSYMRDSKFDTNMVIILAALLCALICALGLNWIVRCAMRCRQRLAPESPELAAATGLKKSRLRRIPVAVYGSGAGIPATECPICLGEFEDGQKVRVLPRCNHGFHVRCIDTWLLSHSSCPNCRHSLLVDQAMDRSPGGASVAVDRSPEGASVAMDRSPEERS